LHFSHLPKIFRKYDHAESLYIKVDYTTINLVVNIFFAVSVRYQATCPKSSAAQIKHKILFIQSNIGE